MAKILKLALLIFFSANVFAQTAGSLTFSCATDAPSGTWGTKHVLAIWIQDTQNPSKFVKTRAKYGHEDDHLTSWSAISGKNLVDAITGATLTSYDTRSVIWDGTDVNSNVVADGTYKVFIEMGWGRDKTTQHAVTSFTFTKGADLVQLTPAGDSNYSDVMIEWKPTVTLVNQLKLDNLISVYPNPTNGIITLDFKTAIESAKVSVDNESGITVYSNLLQKDFAGILNIDLTDAAAGLYIIKVESKESQYVYKLLLDR